MARPNKIGIPYFSMDTDFFEDTKIKMLISKFKSDGVFTYLKIINTGYKEHGYFLPADEDTLLVLSGELSIDFDQLNTIIEFMCNKNLFNVIQKQTNNILTSERMQMQYLAGTERREEISFNSNYLLVDPTKVKRKTHRAKIFVDGNCITETEFLYNNNPEKDNINSQSKVKKSESESESEIESKKKVKVNNSTSETFFSQTSFEELSTSHLEFVRNLFKNHSRIRDPNLETHVKPILNFFTQIPQHMTEDDIKTCILTIFSRLDQTKGVVMDFLTENIQSKITAKSEEILEKNKQFEQNEARNERIAAATKTRKENEAYLLQKKKEILSTIRDNPKQFKNHEKQAILDYLEKNQILSAEAIFDRIVEEAPL